MSLDRTELGCNGKQSYPSQAEARAACVGISKRRGGGKADFYFCPQCQGFHIARQSTYARVSARIRRYQRLWGAHGDGVGA